MDRSDEGKEVSFRSRGTTDLERGLQLEESSEASTERHIIDTVTSSADPIVTSSADPIVTSKDTAINSVLLYLVEEVKKLKKRDLPVSVKRETSECSLSDVEEDNISILSSKTELIPKDLGRWKTTK